MCHVNPQIHGSSLFYDTQLSIIDYIFMILVHIGAHHLSSDTLYTSRFFVGSPHSPHSIYSIPSSCAINFHPFPPFFYLFIIANWLPHIHHWLLPCCIYQITLYNNYIMFHRISTVSLPSLVKYPFLSPFYPSFLLAIHVLVPSPSVSLPLRQLKQVPRAAPGSVGGVVGSVGLATLGLRKHRGRGKPIF